jgi:hypothetical protein
MLRRGDLVTRRDYDIFEKFSDGSALWRACVSGRFEALRKTQELRELSENDFYIVDVQAAIELTSSELRTDDPPHGSKSATAGGG